MEDIISTWDSINNLLFLHTLKIQMGKWMVDIAIFIKLGIKNKILAITEATYTWTKCISLTVYQFLTLNKNAT